MRGEASMPDVMSVRLWLEGVRVLGVPVDPVDCLEVEGVVAVPAVWVQVRSGVGVGG